MVEVNGIVLDLVHCELSDEMKRPQGLSEEDKSILETIRQGYLPAPIPNRSATMLMEMIDDDEWICNSEDEEEVKMKMKMKMSHDSEIDSSVIISDEDEGKDENKDDGDGRKHSSSHYSEGRSSLYANITPVKPATPVTTPVTMSEARRRSLGISTLSPTKTISNMRSQASSHSSSSSSTQRSSAIPVPQARHSVSVTSYLAREQQLVRERRTMPVSRTTVEVRGTHGNISSTTIPSSPNYASRTNTNTNTIPSSPSIPSRLSLPPLSRQPSASSLSSPLPTNTNRHAVIMNMLTTRKSILQSLKKAKDYWTILEQITDALFLATCIDLVGKRLQPRNERERDVVRTLIKRCFESKREK